MIEANFEEDSNSKNYNSSTSDFDINKKKEEEKKEEEEEEVGSISNSNSNNMINDSKEINSHDIRVIGENINDLTSSYDHQSVSINSSKQGNIGSTHNNNSNNNNNNTSGLNTNEEFSSTLSTFDNFSTTTSNNNDSLGSGCGNREENNLTNDEMIMERSFSLGGQFRSIREGGLIEHFIVVGLSKDTVINHGEKISHDGKILYSYPPDKPCDPQVVNFCFPDGIKLIQVKRRNSLTELNSVLYKSLSQLEGSDSSFMFLITGQEHLLYGACVLNTEMINELPGFFPESFENNNSVDNQEDGGNHSTQPASPFCFFTPRCYCVISRFPFFKSHFDFIYSIIGKERLSRVNKLYQQQELFEKTLQKQKEQESLTKSQFQQAHKRYTQYNYNTLQQSQPIQQQVGQQRSNGGNQLLNSPPSKMLTASSSNDLTRYINKPRPNKPLPPLPLLNKSSYPDTNSPYNFTPDDESPILHSNNHQISPPQKSNEQSSLLNQDLSPSSSNNHPKIGSFRTNSSVSHSRSQSTPISKSITKLAVQQQQHNQNNNNNNNNDDNKNSLQVIIDESLSAIQESLGSSSNGGDDDFDDLCSSNNSFSIYSSFNGSNNNITPAHFVNNNNNNNTNPINNSNNDSSKPNSLSSSPITTTTATAITSSSTSPSSLNENNTNIDSNNIVESLSQTSPKPLPKVPSPPQLPVLPIIQASSPLPLLPSPPQQQLQQQQQQKPSLLLNNNLLPPPPSAPQISINQYLSSSSSSTNSFRKSIPNSISSTNISNLSNSSKTKSYSMPTSLSSSQPNEPNLIEEEIQTIEYYYTRSVPLDNEKLILQFPGDQNPTTYEAGDDTQQLERWCLSGLVKALSLKTVLQAISCILLEKYLLVTSKNIGTISNSVFAFIPLLRPYIYQGAFIPVLPNSALDALYCPIPFVIGITKSLTTINDNHMSDALSNCYILDIDRDQIIPGSNCVPMLHLPNQERLEFLLKPFYNEVSRDIRRKYSVDYPFKSITSDWKYIQSISNEFKLFNRFILESIAYLIDWNPNFDFGNPTHRGQLLKLISPLNQNFIDQFLSSQLFTSHTELLFEKNISNYNKSTNNNYNNNSNIIILNHYKTNRL